MGDKNKNKNCFLKHWPWYVSYKGWHLDTVVGDQNEMNIAYVTRHFLHPRHFSLKAKKAIFPIYSSSSWERQSLWSHSTFQSRLSITRAWSPWTTKSNKWKARSKQTKTSWREKYTQRNKGRKTEKARGIKSRGEKSGRERKSIKGTNLNQEDQDVHDRKLTNEVNILANIFSLTESHFTCWSYCCPAKPRLLFNVGVSQVPWVIITYLPDC